MQISWQKIKSCNNYSGYTSNKYYSVPQNKNGDVALLGDISSTSSKRTFLHNFIIMLKAIYLQHIITIFTKNWMIKSY